MLKRNLNTKCGEKILKFDVVVIGSGLSGVMAALRASSQGKKVAVVRKGWGASALVSGIFEIAPTQGEQVEFSSVLASLKAKNLYHPYHHLDLEALPTAFELFKKFFPLKIQGSYTENHLFLSDMGFWQRAAFAMESQFLDFRTLGRKKVLTLGYDFSWFQESQLLPQMLAKKLDHPEEVRKCAQQIKSKFQLHNYDLLLFPPVLGLDFFSDMKRELEHLLGLPVYETVATVPSVPGLRFQKALDASLHKASIPLIQGKVKNFDHHKKKITTLRVSDELATEFNETTLEADLFILATGKFFSGGLRKETHFLETVFHLPLFFENEKINQWDTQKLLKKKFFKSQPLFQCGVKTNSPLIPLDEFNEPCYENVRACGTVLQGFDPNQDGTRFGVQILSGYKAGDMAS